MTTVRSGQVPGRTAAVHMQLVRRGPNFKGRIRDLIKALRGDDEDAVDRAAGHLIGCCKGEMIFRRVVLKEVARLERELDAMRKARG